MKILKFFLKLLLIILAVAVNIVEAVVLAVTYTLWFIGFLLHVVFKKLSEWIVAITKMFNFVKVFKHFDD